MRSIFNLYRVYRKAHLSRRKSIIKAVVAWNKGF